MSGCSTGGGMSDGDGGNSDEGIPDDDGENPGNGGNGQTNNNSNGDDAPHGDIAINDVEVVISLSEINAILFQNFINSLDQNLQDWTNNPFNKTVKDSIEDFLVTNQYSDEAENFAKKTIDIIRGATNVSTLTTSYENQSFVSLIGAILSTKNNTIFSDFNTALNGLDINNSLTVSEWNIISSKIFQINNITNNYIDLSSLTDISQLSTADQNAIVQNSLFIFSLPSLKDLGIQLPQTTEEWVEFGEILVEVIKEIIPDLIPGVAELNSLKNSIQAFNVGNYTDGSTELVFAIMGVFPASKVLKALGKFAKLIKKTGKIFKTYLKLFKLNKPLAKGYKVIISDSNKMLHIFGNSTHKLSGLVFKAGGEKEALLSAVNKVQELGLHNSVQADSFKRFKNINVLGEIITIDVFKDLNGEVIRIPNMFKP